MPFMKKLWLHNLLMLTFVLIASHSLSQPTSLGLNYQAVARSSSGDLLQNQDLTVRIRLRQNAPNGDVVYQETHQIRTNEYGLFNLVIGEGNQVSQRSFMQINWDTQSLFVQVTINNEDLGTERLQTVPYSKIATNMRLEHLENVDNNPPSNGQVLKWNGNSWLPSNDNTGNTSYSAGNGIQINNNVITNTQPDQEVKLEAGNGIQIQGNYPSFQISTTNNNGNSVWSTRGNRIFYEQGNVGIGTNDPDSDLDVEGNVRILGAENSYGNNGNDNTALKIESQDGGGRETMILDGNEIDCINDVLYIQGNSDEVLLLARGGGNVGIGNFNNPSNDPPEYNLHILHGNNEERHGLAIQNEEDENIWNIHNYSNRNRNNFDENLLFVNNGEIRGKINPNGNYARVSDLRLKTDIRAMDGLIDKILLLQPKAYHFKDDQTRQMGFIAQDVQKIFPEIVDYDEKLDLYMLNYDMFSVLAIEAVKEQQYVIDQQKRQLTLQEQRLTLLEKKIDQLEKNN